ncbi:MAG: DNA primase, partial [Deltaproteobacteria bacterium]|nr:DNA primase [Deltaproteobacteria bacterium]
EGQPLANEIIPCANGLLHTSTRTLLPPDPKLFSLNALPVAFNSKAKKPRGWLKFLKELFGTDKESIELLQELFGMLLIQDTRFQKIFLMVGPKRSGKGTIARILRELIGEDNTVSPTLSDLSRHFGLQPLIGKQLAVITDARLGYHTDVKDVIERLLSISGEDAITIDRKNKDAWSVMLSTRFLILTNEFPRLVDASGAMASRFIPLILTRSFYGKEDLELTERLLKERPGILNWALEGLERLKERGRFVLPEASKEAVIDLEGLGSPIKDFIEERYIQGPGKIADTGFVYKDYANWAVENGARPGLKSIFGRDLKAAFPEIKKVRIKRQGKRVHVYEGIAPRRDNPMWAYFKELEPRVEPRY